MKQFAAALLALLLFCAPAMAKPKAGDILPDMEIKAAPLPAEVAYLGLPEGAKSFRLSQVKADALLVEIFSMYCPRCQASAKSVNAVFENLSTLPEGKKLKMLGLGAGNSAFEVNAFRKQFQIPVPLFQDGDYALHKTFGNVYTPTYMILKPAPGGKGFQVLHIQEGPFGNGEEFLENMLRISGVR